MLFQWSFLKLRNHNHCVFYNWRYATYYHKLICKSISDIIRYNIKSNIVGSEFMNRINTFLRKFSKEVFFLLAYSFFVWLQYIKISGLNTNYLGESLSLNILPTYIIIVFLIPVFVTVFLYLPGLFIIKVKIRFPQCYIYLYDYKLKVIKTKIFIHFNIKLLFLNGFKVLRCWFIIFVYIKNKNNERRIFWKKYY